MQKKNDRYSTTSYSSYVPSRPLPTTRSRRFPRQIVAGLLIVMFFASGVGAIVFFDSKSSNVGATSATASGSTSTTGSNASGKKGTVTTASASMVKNLQASLATAAATTDATVDVAVYDGVTGQTIHYTNATTATTYNTASIVKLSILEELLLQDQAKGITITSAQMAEAQPMIENSSNDAATDLWNEVGAGSAMQSFFKTVGATGTSVNPAGHWGLTQTTALDQLRILSQFAYPTPNTRLNTKSVATVTSLLAKVEDDQDWGISAGPADAGATVLLKNGWLQDTDGWDVNSIGHVKGHGTDYTIAILSRKSDTYADGIATVESFSRPVYTALAKN